MIKHPVVVGRSLALWLLAVVGWPVWAIPIQATPFRDLLPVLGWLYWGAALMLVLLALWLPKRWWHKAATAMAMLALVIYPVFMRPVQKEHEKLQQQADIYKARYAQAKALFDERCKTAGEKIYKTVDDVEGIMLLRARDEHVNDGDQFALDDPYGINCYGQSCIEMYLIDTSMVPEPRIPGSWTQGKRRIYQFVDMRDPVTSQCYRYTQEKAHAALQKNPCPPGKPAHYGVTWNDISTHEDRTYWIAGGSIQVIDLETNEIIAERRGYLMDPGQGNTAAGRAPWSWARRNGPNCPQGVGNNQIFVSKILQPTITTGVK